MSIKSFTQRLGSEIEDPDEETFYLFSQPAVSQDLGFVDSKADAIELHIVGRDLTISQSQGLLCSNRAEGTTGAVLWRVTPLLASWLALGNNVLSEMGIISPDSSIVELGCGSSGILPLILAPRIRRFVATDQAYVFKLLRHNLETNAEGYSTSIPPNRSRSSKKSFLNEPRSIINNVDLLALDWEKSSAASLSSCLPSGETVDLVIACDCIYNEALIQPFVDTCVDICQLREASPSAGHKRTVCIIAQQLRSDSVFVEFLSAFCKAFNVWRVPDEICGENLTPAKGFVVQVGILKL